jgi:N-acetylglucosaminyldiphosphoundecaprenol N-acetyl-beta-D-mannosaminyltransferase
MSRKFVAGVGVDDIDLPGALDFARQCFVSGKQCKIFTPNPEMVVKAQKDVVFKHTLNSGDLNICDGRGLQWASGAKRLSGIDCMLALCDMAAKEGKSIYLLGSGDEETIKLTAENLQKQYPGLRIASYDKGTAVNEDAPAADEKTIQQINITAPAILFVAFGMGKQEKWIAENIAKMPSVKIAMGVGGSFDYISGKIHRAPCWMRKIGLEWLYRLIQQPSRISRIFNAVVVYNWILIKNKFNPN